MEINTQMIFVALTGGILPALLWLWFWLKEDPRPEPRGLLLLSFLGGMAIVMVVLPIEKFAYTQLQEGVLLITVWSAIEEIAKYGAAYFIALKTRFLDEPIDYVIYMITVALGFAALENTLFLINTIEKSGLAEGLATQNLRFIGASLLHVVSSASIGIAMALSYYKGWFMRKTYLLFGLASAILLHALFNFFIIKGSGDNIFMVFGFVWVIAVLFLLIFEKIKRMDVIY
ncbi:MAG: PrsW family glutamic-type intramembrane protease [Patescibacteria group bacterium]